MLKHLFPQAFDIARILADQERRQLITNERDNLGLSPIFVAAEDCAHDPLSGVHTRNQRIAVDDSVRPASEGVFESSDERDDLDVGYFHHTLSGEDVFIEALRRRCWAVDGKHDCRVDLMPRLLFNPRCFHFGQNILLDERITEAYDGVDRPPALAFFCHAYAARRDRAMARPAHGLGLDQRWSLPAPR